MEVETDGDEILGEGNSMTTSDRERMRDFYDALREGEWDRLEETPRGRVAFEIHRHFLARFVQPSDLVLEVGAGPGRFTFELARLGAEIEVTDVSPVQLALHRQHLENTAAEQFVRSRELLDICETSRYPENTFDVVCAYGGPLSYAFEDVDHALAGLFRVTKPGGYVVASVMSWLGTWRYFFDGVLDDVYISGHDALEAMLTTGDLRHLQSSHVCQMFRSSDILDLVTRTGGETVAMSASNWASLGDVATLEAIEADAAWWNQFIRHEVAACAQPGAIDGGTHLMFAAQKPRGA